MLPFGLYCDSAIAEIYKCTGSNGKVTYQDTICNYGKQEQVNTKSKTNAVQPADNSPSGQYDTKTKAQMERAVRGGNFQLLKTLLMDGISPNIIFDEGLNAQWKSAPLLLAARQENRTMVQLLLRFGADIDYADVTGETALLAAVIKDNVEITQMLLDAGANVNHIDAANRPILFRAVDYRRINTIPLLLAAGASLDEKMKANDKGGPYSVKEYFTKVKPAAKIVLVKLGIKTDK